MVHLKARVGWLGPKPSKREAVLWNNPPEVRVAQEQPVLLPLPPRHKIFRKAEVLERHQI